jgi:hypothetical protein
MDTIDEKYTAIMRMLDAIRGMAVADPDCTVAFKMFLRNNIHAEAIDYVAMSTMMPKLFSMGFEGPSFRITGPKSFRITFTYAGLEVYVSFNICIKDKQVLVKLWRGTDTKQIGAVVVDYDGHLSLFDIRISNLLF